MKSPLLSGYFRDGVEPNGRREPAEPWLGSIPNGDSSHNFSSIPFGGRDSMK